MELVEQLKHVYSYNEIYELLYDGPVSFDDMRKWSQQKNCDSKGEDERDARNR